VKFAAIDIGSNAIRLLIEEVHNDEGKYHIEKVSLTRVPVRLGEDVFTKGKVSKERIRQLVKTMKAFWYLMEVHNVVYFRACATSAMREAKNKKEVLSRVKKEANIDIEILSGDEEAELIFSNYFAQNLRKEQSYLYIDVGGGSTELTLIRGGERIIGKSFDLGTVRILTGAVKPSEWKKVHVWLDKAIPKGENLVGIGTGGNVNTMFKLQGKKMQETISRKEIEEQHNYLSSFSLEQRIVKLRMKPDRADVILPAARIYLTIMEHAGISDMIVPKIGLSDGIILDMFNSWKESPVRWKRDFIL
jgi:exopolyphosphatase / guanosine-5'-triphosphate,3'-diphosphate pyrophosphatase